MKSKQDIYALIRSLDKPEKRYFKIYSKKYGKAKPNNYIQIFDFINKKGVNTDSELLILFENKITANQLAVTKNHLYKMLLNAMGSYYKNGNNTMNDNLIHIEFLIHKGLINQAKEIVQVAKKEICTGRQLNHAFNLLELELKLDNYTPESLSIETLNEYYKKQNEILAQHELIVYYKHLFYRKNLFEQKGQIKGSGCFQKEFEDIYNKSMSKIRAKHHSFESTYYAHLINKHCSINLGNLDNFLTHGKKLVLHLKNNSDYLKHDPEKLAWAYYSYLYAYILLKMSTSQIDDIFNEFEKTIENELSKKRITYVVAKMIYYYFYLKRNVLLNDNEVNSELIDVIETFTSTNEDLIALRYKMLFQYYFAYHYFNRSNFKLCLFYLQNTFILYNQRTENAKDVFVMAKLLQALCYRELNEEEHLSYILLSLYRYLSQESTAKIFEKRGLMLVKALINDKLNYRSINEKIKELNANNGMITLINLFDFESFVKKKLNST